MTTAAPPEGIAIIGLAGRFPGARDVHEFWRNLVEGRDGITRLADEQLAASGWDPAKLRALPGYVAARGLVEKPEWFDRGFFGIGPREAEVMDPQHRIFLEVAWEALEDAACDPSRYAGLIGVFAGMSNNTYFPFFVRKRRDLLDAVGMVSAVIANEKDFLTTRLAYKLNLRGPALNIQTACSSSLVTVCVACQNLLDHQCDVALAGGVSLTFPQERGYFFQDGSMTSPDGWCRPFDERANGTVFSSGAGVVVLKRFADALADRDHIYAVIKGHALNNDGAQKVGFAAPSVDGHREVIALAQAVAGIAPETISYIEAHGTATPLGDPVEVAGLTHVFRETTERRQFCALGSVKGNIGHCDAASGVASLIKTALAFEHQQLPPTIHCEQPNPALHLAESPFFLNTALRDWPHGDTPRRAGVSSFGVGGTNAHVVLEEPPAAPPTVHGDAPQLLVLSAKSPSALDALAKNLATCLESNPAALSDIAFTLHDGRQTFPHRRAVVARNTGEAIAALRAPAKSHREDNRLDTRVAFLFPGQGSQYPRMRAHLAPHDPAFRDALAARAALLQPELGLDLRDAIFSTGPEAADRLRETRLTQPAIFAVSLALARLWLARGIQPSALLGHSVGEFVAAAVAGVFSWEDAARLVALRARLTQEQPHGAMLATRLPEEEAREFLADARIALAAVNSPKLCVLSGPPEAIEALEKTFAERTITARRLATSHAFHSPMVEPVIGPLAEAMRGVKLSAPQIPIVSSVTGEWLSDAQATDPQYWANHLRATVRFASAATRLMSERGFALLECGPGQTLSQLVRQSPARTERHEIAHSIHEEGDERESLATALGHLWLAGVPLDWRAANPDGHPRHVSLPTYPFERQRYFADLPPDVPLPLATAATDGEAPVEADGPVPRGTHSPLHAVSGAPQESGSAAGSSPPHSSPSDASGQGAESNTDRACAPQASPLAEVKQLLTNLSGFDLSDRPGSTSLLDLGFDSLFLSQAALTISRKFGVKITVRQLLGELGTLDTLAAALPTSAVGSASTEAPAPSPVRLPPSASSSHGPFRPLQRDLGAELSARQQRWLTSFIDRYNARTSSSKAHTQQHRAHFADPRAAAGFKQPWKEIVYPIVTCRSSGARLSDIDGNEWLDVTLSFGAAMLGHQPPFVVGAIRDQLIRGYEIGPTSPLAGEVAALLCKLTGMERATFCNTGSEAVTGALRAARTVTGRAKIVYFRESYHGIDNEVLGRRAGDGVLPIAPGIPEAAVADVIILDYGDPRSLAVVAAHAGEIAAVLVEPVQSRHPALQPREFLHELRALTQQHGIALIFDEIISGFRCHLGGAQAFFGVRADLATYGKVIGGGLPIGAIAGRAQFMDTFDGGAWNFGDDSFPSAAVTFFAGTFVRHPLALAATRAVLTHLEKEGPALQQTLADRARGLFERVRTALGDAPYSIESFASNWLIRPAPEFRFAGLLFALLRHRGIHIWENRPCFVSTAHSDADLDEIVTAFEESIAELEDAGFFKRTTTTAARRDDGSMPITEAQQEIWLVCQQGREASHAFNETWTLMLDGPLDDGALHGAIQSVIDRHESLRSIFPGSGETIAIAPSLTIDLPRRDLSGLDEAERESQLAALRTAEGSRGFDLERGPLVAIQLVRLAPERHALVFNAHHLVCDGWSCDVFITEVAAIYSAAREGRPHQLPEPMSMRDYARFMEELRETPEFVADAEYWRAQYRTIPPALTLPGDRPHPPQRSFRGASEQIMMQPEFAQALAHFGAQQGATLFNVLFAAFQTLLFRLTGQGDLSVGVPSAGQNLVGGDHLIGHCVNMLPVRSQLAAEQTFAGLLKTVQGTVLEAFEHRRVTFGWLLRQLSFSRVPGRVPLIPVTFNVDPPLSHIHFAGLVHRLEANPRSAFQFDLGFNCDTTPRGFRLICHYNTDLFDAATIRRWLDDYCTLLASLAEDPSQRLGAGAPSSSAGAVPEPAGNGGVPAAAPLHVCPSSSNAGGDSIPVAHRDPVPVEWHGTDRPFPAEKGVHQIFEEAAARMPDAIAIQSGNETLTYGELNARANRLARRLRALGFQRERCIGLCMERSASLIVSILGILKAGYAYLPLDPAYPGERLALMLAESGAPLVLAQQKFAGRVPAGSARILEIENMDLLRGETADLGLPASGTDCAYVMFTSGSTGTPKGSVILHRGISRLVVNTDYVELTPKDVIAHISNTSFDASTFEIWGALLSGARLVVVPKETLLTPNEFIELLQRTGVTTLFITTPLFHQLAREAPTGFGSVRWLIVGGETLDPTAVRAVLESGTPPANLMNAYGPTETTTFATCHRIPAAGPEDGVIPIGRPIANTSIHLLDPAMAPVPPGEPGEIYIGGPGVARGYLNRPELTAASFVVDPFSTDETARLYRTGDRARWLPDGAIEFLGRIDEQVKVRGFRVELGEIEAALRQHPSVDQCRVVARSNGAEGRTLAGFVTARAGSTPQGDDVRSFLQARLPDFMVPGTVTVLDALPLTPNGKIDISALTAAPGTAPPAISVPAKESVESAITMLWEDLLGRDRLAPDDDFFLIGGHSLLAIRLIGRLRERFAVDVPVQRLFETPTIRGLAEFISSRLPVPSPQTSRAVVMIQRGDESREPLFLVPGGWGGEEEFLVYGQLARHLDPTLPIYGLKMRDSAEQALPEKTVEEFAAIFIDEICAVQPQGPYLLAGECVGGIVAYEMAGRLRQAGKEVALLLLLDAEWPNRASLDEFVASEKKRMRNQMWDARVRQPAQRHWEKLRALPMREKWSYLWERARRRPTPPTDDPAAVERDLLTEYPRRLMAHQPTPHTAKVTLVIAEQAHSVHGNIGWDIHHPGELEVHVVPGDHISYIRQNAAAAAAKLREIIDRVRQPLPC